jgi:hypothetical protein
MHENDKIDRYFREQLGSFEQSPPDATWNAIAQKLDKTKRKGIMLLLFRIAAGMAILISTGIGYYLIHQPDKSTTAPKVAFNEKSAVTGINKVSTLPGKPSGNLSSNQLQHNKPAREIRTDREHVLDNVQIESTVKEKPIIESIIPVQAYAFYGFAPVPIEGRKAAHLQMMLSNDMSLAQQRRSDTITEEEAIALVMAEYNEAFSDELPSPERKQRWILGSEVAPLYSSRTINSGSLEQETLDNLNKSESGILAYAGGVRIAYATSKRLSIQSGLYYSRYGQKKNDAQVYNMNYAGSPTLSDVDVLLSVTNSTGIISGSGETGIGNTAVTNDLGVSAENSNHKDLMSYNMSNDAESAEGVVLKQYFDYFEVPLILKYKMIDRKIDVSFSGGLVTNFLIGNKVDMIMDGKSYDIGETSDINEINYSGSFGLGLEYPLVTNFDLTLEPRFRYYLNSIDKSSQLLVHPYSFGFFAGINYRF